MKIFLAMTVLSILSIVSISPLAQEDQSSQNLIKTGKDNLNSGRLDEALAVFNNATLDNKSLWQPFYYKGITLYKLNRYDEALDAFNESITRNSSNANIWFQKGLTLIKLARYDEARTSLDNATRYDPNFEEAWYNLGLTWSKLGNSNQAISAYEEVIKLNKSNEDAWYFKGLIHQNLKRYNKAIEAYNNVTKGPHYKDALLKKGESLLNSEDRKHEGYYYEGISQYLRGRDKEALKYLDESLRINSSYDLAWFTKGLALLRLNDIEGALYAFNRTSEINKSFAEAYYYKGFLYGKKGEYQNALKSLDKAIIALIDQEKEKTPLAADAWYYRGVALRKLGRDDEAFRSFNYGNSSDAGGEQDAAFWIKRGEQLGNKGWHYAALLALTKATNNSSISNKDAKAWYNFGLAYYSLERYEDAVSAFNKTIKIIQENETTADNILLEKAWVNKAATLSYLNRGDEALEAIQEAIDLNGSSMQAWYTKGSILFKLNKSEEANQSFSQAIKLDPSDANAWYGMAKTEAIAGKHKEALKSYEMAINRNKHFEQAWIDKGEIYKALNHEGEALVSFDMALEAINHNEAVLFCDKGYALRVRGRDHEALEAFTRSLEIDPQNAAAWYNKSIVLVKLNDSTEANKAIEKAALFKPTYKDMAEFWSSRGKIFLNLNRSEDALKAFDESLNRNLLYQDAWYGKYLALIKLGKGAEAKKAKKFLDQIGSINSTQSSSSEGPTDMDIDLFENEIRRNRQKVAYAWDGKADALYKLDFTEKALQSYVEAKKWSAAGNYESAFTKMLLILYFISLLIIIIFAFRRDSIANILIGVNVSSFIAFGAVISEFFDISRAFWSLAVIALIQAIALLALLLLGYRNSIWLGRVNLIFRDFSRHHNKWYYVSSLIFCLVSIIFGLISVIYLIILRISFSPNHLDWIRGFMSILLATAIVATCIPLVKLLTSKFVSIDARKILAVEQFAYLSSCAVPLSWILWSFGFPSGKNWNPIIEDIPIRIPVSTAVLLILFALGFVVPYYYGYLNNKEWINNLRKQEIRWLEKSIKLTNEPEGKEKDQKRLEEIKSDICKNLQSVFKNTPSLCETYENCLIEPKILFKYVHAEIQNSTQLWKGSADKYYQDVSDIIKGKFKLLDEPQLKHMNLSMTTLVILQDQFSDNDKTWDIETTNIVKENSKIQPKYSEVYSKLKTMVEKWTELDSQDKTKMWANFITVFITPLLPLMLSVLAPWMGLPIDQGSLVKLVSDASSQYTFGF